MKSIREQLLAHLVAVFIVYIMCIMTRNAHAFNLDIEDARASVFYDPVNRGQSFFGYTVALFEGLQDKWLLVGAPKSNSSYIPSSVESPGALFKCPVSGGQCEEVKVDDKGNVCYSARLGRYIESSCSNNAKVWHKKDHQWLGAGLDVETKIRQNRPVKVTVCAPRWINQYWEKKDANEFLMNGYCWELTHDGRNDELGSVRALHPLSDVQLQIHDRQYKYANGLAGMVVHYPEDSKELVLSAPGVWDSTGSTIEYKENRQAKDATILLLDNLPIGSFLGYATTSGTFFPFPDAETMIVAGAPRFPKETAEGMVFIFTGRFERKIAKRGKKSGEYFGASLCVINMDTSSASYLHSLLVGAPFYYEDDKIDMGRVYVYKNKGTSAPSDPLQEAGVLDGSSTPRSRFGTAIANVGDLDYDGYNDVAIGAPMEDDGKGAVYIYHGYKDGIRTEYSQRISASDIAPTIKGFGWTFSKSVDVDSNNYPDFAVGAYDSGNAVLFRTRPVLHTQSWITFKPAQINLNKTQCTYNNQPVTCTEATVCWNYTGKYVPSIARINYTLAIQHKVGSVEKAFIYHQGSRHFQVSGTKTLSLNSAQACTQYMVHLQQTKDILNPILLLLEYDLQQSMTRRKRQAFNPLTPILSKPSERQLFKLNYAKDCGEDDVCTSNLHLYLKTDFKEPQIIPGVDNSIQFLVSLENRGESAYQTEVYITHTAEAKFVKASSNNLDIVVLCSVIEAPSNELAQLRCEIANPLRAQTTVEFSFDLELDSLQVEKPFEVRVEATTTSDDMGLGNNVKSFSLPVQYIADVKIRTSSEPEQLIYNSTKKEQNIPTGLDGYSREISHVYDVFNIGPSTIERSNLIIKWPGFTKDGRKLIQFMEFEVNKGEHITCNATNVLYKKAKEEQTDGRKSGLEGEPETSDETATETRNENPRSLVHEEGEIIDINCDTTNCTIFTCNVPPLAESQSYFLRIKARINEQVLLSMNVDEKASLISKAEVLILSQVVQPDGHEPDSAEARTGLVRETLTDQKGKVPIWIIIVAIIAGILLLVVLIVILIKVGFFKRKQKEDLEKLKGYGEFQPELVRREETEALNNR